MLGLFIGLQNIKAVAPKEKPQSKTVNKVIVPMPMTGIPTRPMERYRRVGYLYSEHDHHRILPLHGRRVYAGGLMWNYYIHSADHTYTVQIPLAHKGRKCDSEYGCHELYDGDHVNVPEYGGNYIVKLYDTSVRYNPFYV